MIIIVTLNLFSRGLEERFPLFIYSSSFEELNLSGAVLDKFIKSRNADLVIKAVHTERKNYALKTTIVSCATALNCSDTIRKL